MANITQWEKLHENPRYWPEYPSERVVQWAFREFGPADGGALLQATILDYGCGAGRHAIFLAENKFDVEACDVSKNGLEIAQMRALGRNLEIPFKHQTTLTLPYPDETFDGVLCYGVLYYLTREEIPVAIDEIKRVLKPGGKALVVVRSKADSRYEGDVGRGDDGMDMVFLDKDELYYLFRGFSEVHVDSQKQTYGKETDADWIINLCK